MAESPNKRKFEDDGSQTNANKKRKLDPELASKVLKQVEFYFSDSNFPKDKFLRAQAALDAEGYVSLDKILTFKRMQELCTDKEAVVEVLRDSSVIQLNPDETMVKRIAPLPENDITKERTAFTEGWPENVTMEQVSSFFSSIGSVLSVRFIKDTDKHLTGKVYVEFSSVEELQKAISKSPMQFNESSITIISKNDYFKQLKEKEDKQEKKPKKNEKKQGEKKEEKKEAEYPKGTIVVVDGIGENVSREVLKELFGDFGEVSFVDFKLQKEKGFVRYKDPSGAAKALKEFSSELGGKLPKLSLLSGDEEKAYWDSIREGQAERAKKGKGKKKFQRRRRK